MSVTTLFQGDTLNDLIRIDFDEESRQKIAGTEFATIAKVVFQCGEVRKVIPKPQFPLLIGFTRQESKKLKLTNTCYIAIYNDKDEKKTLIGSLTFKTNSEVVKDV